MMNLRTDAEPHVPNLRIILPKNGQSCLTLAAVGGGAAGIVRTPSYRYRAAHVLNNGTEVLLDKHDEVMPFVINSLPQSAAVEGTIQGTVHRTTIDRSRLLSDGTRQFCECKSSWADFYRPRAIIQRLLGQAAADALGFDWVPIVPETLGSRIVRNNVDRIYGARGVRFPDHVAAHAAQILGGGPMTLGDFTRALDRHEGNAFSMACAMMVRRHIEMDLSKPIGHSSLVRAAAPIPKGLPSIRLRRGQGFFMY